jgi:hypothetical protein
MTRKSVPSWWPTVMQGADVGVVQRGNGTGFALEALPGLGIGRKMRRQDLDRDGAIQACNKSVPDISCRPSVQTHAMKS